MPLKKGIIKISLFKMGVAGLMSAFTVQIIVFFFSGATIITGICLVIKGKTAKAPIRAVFTTGLILMVIAAIDPYTISKIAIGKWLKIERHQPSKEERKSVLKLATDTATTISPEEKEKLVVDAKLRPDQKRSPEDYLVLATEAWRAKKYDNALQFAFNGLNLKPSDTRVKATLIHRIGSVYNNLNIPDLAIKYYKNAMEKDPKFSWPHNNLGLIYYEQKKYAEAEKEYKKAIVLNPENAAPHSNLGLLYYEQKKYVEAEKKYNKAIEIDPKYAMPHNSLGFLYYEQKKYVEAEKEYKKTVELDPKFSWPHNNLGLIYYVQKKYAEAEKEYKKAIVLDPENAAPYNGLGILYSVQKKYVEAEKEYNKAIVLDPNLKAARENLKILQSLIKTN
jgi:tetratricopeptide (TPR) repeat protein